MQLHFRKFGEGCPLLILHGLYGSGDNWLSIGKAMEPYFSIYLIDQRNHGNSLHSDEHNYNVLASDLEQFIKEHKLNKVCIIGHSMGGKVAMNFTLNNPEKVQKLVVIDIAMRSYSESENNFPQMTIHKKIISGLAALDIEFAETREEIDKQLARYISQKKVRQFLLKNIKRNKSGEFYWGLNINALKSNLHLLLDRIESNNRSFLGPVLIISGKNSGYIQQEDYNEFQRVFPNAEFAEFNAGHWIHAEQPDKLIDKLLEFLPPKR